MDTRSKGGKQIGKKVPGTEINKKTTITVSQAIKDLRTLSETCPICNLSETNFFSETNLKFYPLFYNHNIILFISLRLNVLDFNISAFLFKIQMHL